MTLASTRRSSQIGNERRIVIDEVDVANLRVTGKDVYGTTFVVSYDMHDPLVAVPQTQELWTIVQYQNEWRLDRRLESNTQQTPIVDLQPGDRRIEADSTLYLNGVDIKTKGAFDVTGSIAVNGQDLLQLIQLAIPAGVVVPYAGAILPTGWDWANGATVDSVANPTYAKLWSAIGTLHGGTGPSNFNKPDVQGRMIVGHGVHADVSTLGATEGVAVINRTMKHYHDKGTIAVTASGAHGHTFTGTFATITGGAHGHTFTGTGGTTATESGHTHGPGTYSISGGSHTHTDSGHSHGITNVDAFDHSGGTGATGTAGGDRALLNVGLGSGAANISTNSHTHPSGEFSGATAAGSAHSHTFTPAGTLSNTDTHSHSYTPAGTLSTTNTHVHNTADFSGLIGTTTGISESPAYIVLNHIVKL